MAYHYRQAAPSMPPQLGGVASGYGVPQGYGGFNSPYSAGFQSAYDGAHQLGYGGSVRAFSPRREAPAAVDRRFASDRHSLGTHSLQSPAGYQGYAQFGGAQSTRAPSYSQLHQYVAGPTGSGSWPANSASSSPWAGISTPTGAAHHPGHEDLLYSRYRGASGRAATPRRNVHTPPVPPPWAPPPASHDLAHDWREARNVSAPSTTWYGEGEAWNVSAPSTGWEVRIQEGDWQPWVPGVPFNGFPREEVHYVVGPFTYVAIFDDTGDAGVEINLTTRARRWLRRRASELPGKTSPGRARTPPADVPAWMQDTSPERSLNSSARLEHSVAANEMAGPQAAGGGIDAVAANATASEAYRELQKLGGSGKAQPSTEEVPDVIPLGDGELDCAPIALGDGPIGVATTASSAHGRAEAEKMEKSALGKLFDLRGQVCAVEQSVLEIDRALNSSVVSPGQARDQLAQLEARLSQLQCDGIDSVSCAGLAGSDAEEVRARRKELTRQTERLQSCLESIFARIASMRNERRGP